MYYGVTFNCMSPHAKVVGKLRMISTTLLLWKDLNLVTHEISVVAYTMLKLTFTPSLFVFCYLPFLFCSFRLYVVDGLLIARFK